MSSKVNFKKDYLIYKETQWAVCLYNVKNRFFFWLKKKDVTFGGKTKKWVESISENGLNQEDEEFTAYLNETKDPMKYSMLPPRKPDFVTEKAYGWKVRVVFKEDHGERAEEVRLYFPKIMADLKRGVVKRELFEESEFKILSNYVVSCPMRLDLS